MTVALTVPIRNTAPHLHITRRGRMTLTALLASPLVIAAFVFLVNGGISSAQVGVTGNNFAYVTVAPGQSLWQLAETVAPTADPRDVIANIVVLNRLEGSVLHAGERLAIPAVYAK